MSVKLKKLLKNFSTIEVKGSKEVYITGLCSDSRCVSPGNLFIAKRGRTFDGTQFISQAIDAGASAILTDLYNPVLKNITQLISNDVDLAEAHIAEEYYQRPNENLLMTGITGTSGKTSTSYMIKHFLEKLKGPCGLIGTIECIIGNTRYQTGLTTPDVITNFKLIKEMVNQGCSSAVMEVSSHALEQRRVENIKYDIAIFTNLSAEHLDYHKNMENYAQAKRNLFISPTKSKQAFAVVNKDDPYTEYMIQGTSREVITYSIKETADLYVTNLLSDLNGMKGLIHYKNRTLPFNMPLIGNHNIYNLLAAIAVPLTQGYHLDKILSLTDSLQPIRGRLEKVPNPLGIKIIVDFAHKDFSLQAVLEAIQASCRGKIITVFGCGGNRDPHKRPRMAKVSQNFSQITIVTSDNPRNESPEQIIKEIVAGFSSLENVIIQPDRRKAISQAIDLANSEDVILIAGKGHERQQILAHTTIPFDDREVAYELCCEKYKGTHSS